MRLASRPTVGGLVRPWVNVVLADGGTDFRQTHGSNWRNAWLNRLCQVDGQKLTTPMVFLGGPNQVAEGGFFDEPPLHPECAAYASKACPMISGRMSHYRGTPSATEGRRGQVCPDPGCDCRGYLASEQVLDGKGGLTVRPADERPAPVGEPAHAWFAVYARSYRLAMTPEGRVLGGVPVGVVRVRELNASEQSGATRNDPEQPGPLADGSGCSRTGADRA
jgi:hypothetical protein